MLEWLKWKLCKKELEELNRRRVLMSEYRAWLSEFKDISLVLDNMQAEIEGQALDICRRSGCKGPWDVQGLRFNLRLPKP